MNAILDNKGKWSVYMYFICIIETPINTQVVLLLVYIK